MLTELKVTSDPAVEVATADVKSFMRVDYSDDDTFIELLIKQAREKAENYCNRAFITQTLQAYYDRVDTKIILPRAPIQSVSSIKLKYLGETVTLVADSDYYVMGNKDKWIELTASAYALPAGFSMNDDLSRYYVEITYVAGYGSAYTSVPAGIQIAIMKMVQTNYDHRVDLKIGNIVSDLPNEAKKLLNPYRILTI